MQNCAYVGTGARLTYAGNDGNVRINTGTKQGTVSFWYRENWALTHEPEVEQWLVAFNNATGNQHWSVSRYDARLHFLRSGNYTSIAPPSNYGTMFPGKWYHVVLTWDLSGGLPGTWAVYWDGSKSTGTFEADVFSGVEPATIEIGSRYFSSAPHGGCMAVANVAIWDGVATDAQVQDLLDLNWRHVPITGDGTGSLIFRATFRAGWDADAASGTATATHTVNGTSEDCHQSLARLVYHGDDTLTQRCRDIGTIAAGRDPLSWWTNVEGLALVAPAVVYAQDAECAMLTYPVGSTHTVPLAFHGEQTGNNWLCRAKLGIDGDIDDDTKRWDFCGLQLGSLSIKFGSTKLIDLVGTWPDCHAWNAHYVTAYTQREVQVVKSFLEQGCLIFETRPVAMGPLGMGYYNCQGRFFGPNFTTEAVTTVRVEQVEVYGEAAYSRTTRPCCNFVPVVEQRQMATVLSSRDPLEWEALHTEIVFSPPTSWTPITNPGTGFATFGWARDGVWHLLGTGSNGWQPHEESVQLASSADQGQTWEISELWNVHELEQQLLAGHKPFGHTVQDKGYYSLSPVTRPDGTMTLSDGTVTLAGQGWAHRTDCDTTAGLSITGLRVRDLDLSGAQGPYVIMPVQGAVAGSLRNAEGWCSDGNFLQNPYARNEAERIVGCPAQMKAQAPGQFERYGGFVFGSEPLTNVRGARGPEPHAVRIGMHGERLQLWPPGWLVLHAGKLGGVHMDDLFMEVSTDGAILHRIGTIVSIGQLSPEPSIRIYGHAEFEDGEYRRYIASGDNGVWWKGSVRKDGWTSLRLSSGETDGYSRTCQIAQPELGWRKLTVNFDPGAAGGKLEVAVLDPATGAEIAGFGRTDCDDVTLDGTAQEVSWGSADLSGLEAYDNLIFVFHLTRTSAGAETPKVYRWYCSRTVGDDRDLETWPQSGLRPGIGNSLISVVE